MAPPEGVSVDSESNLPLIIRATEGNDSVHYLKKWITDNKSWLEAKMLEHGTSCQVCRKNLSEMRGED